MDLGLGGKEFVTKLTNNCQSYCRCHPQRLYHLARVSLAVGYSERLRKIERLQDISGRTGYANIGSYGFLDLGAEFSKILSIDDPNFTIVAFGHDFVFPQSGQPVYVPVGQRVTAAVKADRSENSFSSLSKASKDQKTASDTTSTTNPSFSSSHPS